VVYGTRSFVNALYWRMKRSGHAAYTKEEWLYDVWVHAEEWACGISYEKHCACGVVVNEEEWVHVCAVSEEE